MSIKSPGSRLSVFLIHAQPCILVHNDAFFEGPRDERETPQIGVWSQSGAFSQACPG